MNKYTLATIVLSLSLLCINIQYCQAADQPDTIFKVCTSKFPNVSINALCNDTLRSSENTCPQDDLRCMGTYINKLAISATQNLQAVAGNTTKSGKGKKKSPAQTCADHINSAMSYLKKCKGWWDNSTRSSIASGIWNNTSPWNTTTRMNKSNLNQYATGAETYLDTCDDEYPGKPENFSIAGNRTLGFISVELAIANLLDVMIKK